MKTTALVYLGDPMCSWCWGFAPVLDQVSGDHGLEVEVVVGGLRPGPAAEPLSPQLESFLRAEWSEIAERTGQPFDTGILDELGRDWMYDSEMGAIAVTQMRRRSPEFTLAFFARVQRAFYAERVDITDVAVYGPLAEEFGLDGDAFMTHLQSDEARADAWSDFSRARRWGITGFPTLLARNEDRLHLLSAGYRPADDVSAALSSLP